MVPELYDGDLLVVDPEIPFTNVRGGIGIVKFDGAFQIRRVYQTGEHYRLEPANRAYEPEIVPIKGTTIFKIVLWIPSAEGKF